MLVFPQEQYCDYVKQHKQNSPCWASGLIKHKKKSCQSLGKQFGHVVCVDEGNRPVVVQQGSGLLALGQQGNEPHGSWQAYCLTPGEGFLQDCQQQN